MLRSRLLPVLGLSLALFACSDDEGDDTAEPGGGGGGSVTVPSKLALVADWFNGSVSYVDVAKVVAGGATRDAVVTGTVDLSKYPPGPLDITITPDKKTALVSSSTGFFAIPSSGILIGAGTIPMGAGKLLMLDIASGKVTAELDTGASPMAIAITPDGKRAVAATFGSGNLNTPDGELAIIDIEAKKVERVPAGLFLEELAFDDTGTVGLFGFGTAGSVKAFSVADPRNTISNELKLDGDNAGIAFFPGTKVAYVVQAPSVLAAISGGAAKGGYTVVDVSDPKAPKVLEDLRFDESPTGYPAAPAKSRGSVLVPATINSRLVLREYKLVDNKASLVNSIDVGPTTSLLAALGCGFDGDHTALLTLPGDKKLVAVDLDAKTAREIPWLSGAAGPADVAF